MVALDGVQVMCTLFLLITLISKIMNKFILSVLCAVMVVSSFAQSEHLTFKGVPIDGTLDEYVAKMKKAGFQYLGKNDGVALLQGDFAGFRGCHIGVSTLKSLDVVNAIGVVFPEADDWAQLFNTYESLKSMLIQKYGDYTDCVEEFQGYSQPRDNSRRLLLLKTDDCTWYTIFETDKGTIKLSMESDVLNNCYVVLSYFDKINTDTVQQQALDDL